MDIFLDGIRITNYQMKTFVQQDEINVLDSFDIAFNDVEVELPIEWFDFLRKNISSFIEIKDGNKVLFLGEVYQKQIDYNKNKLRISSFPYIKNLAYKQREYNQTVYGNAIVLLNEILKNEIDSRYTLQDFVGLQAIFSDFLIALNTDGDTDNLMSIVLTLCEFLNISLYVKGNSLKVFPFPEFPKDANKEDGKMIKKPIITEKPDLYYDKIILQYKENTAGAEKTYIAGDGNVEKKIGFNNIYMPFNTAVAAANRMLSIFSQRYYEIEVEFNKDFFLNEGDFFEYAGFMFFIQKKIREVNKTIITGIGRLKNG